MKAGTCEATDSATPPADVMALVERMRGLVDGPVYCALYWISQAALKPQSRVRLDSARTCVDALEAPAPAPAVEP